MCSDALSEADCGVCTVYKAGVHTGHPLDPLSALEIKLMLPISSVRRTQRGLWLWNAFDSTPSA